MHNETAMYALAQAVAVDHKVVVTGEGADELFAGYGRIFRTPFDYERSRFASALPDWMNSALRKAWHLPKAHLDQLYYFLHHYTYFQAEQKLALARSSWRSVINDDAPLVDHFAAQFAMTEGSFFDRISHVFLSSHLPALLEMVDNTTMAAGVEGRVPYTDHRLIAAAMRIPANYKLRWKNALAPVRAVFKPISDFSERLDTPKFLLRSLYAGKLPRSVSSRRKMGFPLPLGRWAATNESRPFQDLLFQEQPAVSEFLDMSAVQNWYNRNSKNPNDSFGKQFWLICNLELFLRRF